MKRTFAALLAALALPLSLCASIQLSDNGRFKTVVVTDAGAPVGARV